MSTLTITQDNFQTQVVNSNNLILLDFWAPWCGPCRMVSPIVDEISNEFPDVVVGKVNVDEQPGLASEYGVMSIPTLTVLKNGKVVNQAIGVRPKQEILQMLGK